MARFSLPICGDRRSIAACWDGSRMSGVGLGVAGARTRGCLGRSVELGGFELGRSADCLLDRNPPGAPRQAEAMDLADDRVAVPRAGVALPDSSESGSSIW